MSRFLQLVMAVGISTLLYPALITHFGIVWFQSVTVGALLGGIFLAWNKKGPDPFVSWAICFAVSASLSASHLFWVYIPMFLLYCIGMSGCIKIRIIK